MTSCSRFPAATTRACWKAGPISAADNGSDWYFQGEVNQHWTNDLMDELKSIPAGAFVAVNEAGAGIAGRSAESLVGRREE